MTLPLQNCRILVTRSGGQASELAARLDALGASTILIPTIEIAPPDSYDSLDRAIADLGQFDWLVFTSANAVEAFGQRFALHGSHTLAQIRTAVIGPATARAAMKIGLQVALCPEEAVAESLTAALLLQISKDSRILLIRAVAARDHLPDTLRKTAAHVMVVDAYQTVAPTASMNALKELFTNTDSPLDVITFTSSSTVTNLFHLMASSRLTLCPSIIRASIGRITSRTLLEHGFPAHVEATEANIPGLVFSLSEYLKENSRFRRE